MNDSLHSQAENRQNQYALKLVARLSGATEALPHEISERLRAARMQALARRKVTVTRAATAVFASGGAASMSMDDEGLSWWHRLVAAVPLVILALGLVGIDAMQAQYRADEVAEVDSALLTDDLPPSAYLDPGFVHFLKAGQDQVR